MAFRGAGDFRERRDRRSRRALPARRDRRARPRSRSLRWELLEERYVLTAAAATPSVFEIPWTATPLATESIEATQLLNGVDSPADSVAAGTGLAAPFNPSQIAHAYGFDSLYFPSTTTPGKFIKGDGTGETIAIVDPYNQPSIVSDLHNFDVRWGLPDPVLTIVNHAGATSPLEANAPTSGNAGIEISLDVEWAHALAPGAQILLVEAASLDTADLNAAVTTASNSGLGMLAGLPSATVVSMSFGGSNTTSHNNSTLYGTPAGKPGVTFVASSGDTGALGFYPASDPNVLGVGGTSLTINSDGSYGGEVAWSGSNGGPSPNPKLTYQTGVHPFGQLTPNKRMSPDVSFDADIDTGVYVYDSYDGPGNPWYEAGGTSLSAPAWAALIADADQARGSAGPLTGLGTLTALYSIYSGSSYAYDFHDVASGANTNYSAGTGYDYVTGIGSPRADTLAAALAGVSEVPTPTSTSGTVITTTTPTFQWSAVGGATGYNLTITDTTTHVTIANALLVAGTSYTPSAPLTNGDSFQWQVQAVDSFGTMAAASSLVTFTEAVPNHAPTGANNSVTTLEDTPYKFAVADFRFSDPNDNPPNALLAVKITTPPTAGALTDNNILVVAGQSIPVGDIASGLLKFIPVANLSGSPYASFTFQVQDNGGTTGSGVDLDPVPKTMSITVTHVNDAPTGANNSVTTPEDTPYKFAVADFGFSDPNDSPPNTLLAVKITTPPTAGALMDNNNAVVAGQSIPVGDIASGSLLFIPAANLNGAPYASFTFQVQDNGGTGGGGVDLDPAPKTMSVTVTPVNDAPSGANNSVTTPEDTPYQFAVADFGFSDPNDNPPNTLLAVKITTPPTAGALMDNNIAVVAGQSIPVGDIASGSLLFIPVANANGAPYASFTFQVQDNGGTGGGGVDLDPAPKTMSVTVTPVNDAPTGANNSVTTPEGAPYKFAVADFGFTDPNDIPPNTLLAVEITTLPLAGALTDNNNAVVAGQFIPVGDIASGSLQFIPAANTSGSPYASFTFQVQDNGGTTPGVDLDPSPKTMSITVTPNTTPPEVVSVLVDGSSWSSNYLNALQTAGTGVGGYAIPAGSNGDFWLNDLNQIQIVFSENVHVQQNSLTVTGVGGAYSFSNFSYNAATLTATWTLTAAPGADRLQLDLHSSGPAAVTDLDGNALDGEWIAQVSNYPSGDGVAGGDFVFPINVLPGDVDDDGFVDINDLTLVANNWLQHTVLGDVNGDDSVDIQDLTAIANDWLRRLPTGGGADTPLAVSAPATINAANSAIPSPADAASASATILVAAQTVVAPASATLPTAIPATASASNATMPTGTVANVVATNVAVASMPGVAAPIVSQAFTTANDAGRPAPTDLAIPSHVEQAAVEKAAIEEAADQSPPTPVEANGPVSFRWTPAQVDQVMADRASFDALPNTSFDAGWLWQSAGEEPRAIPDSSNSASSANALPDLNLSVAAQSQDAARRGVTDRARANDPATAARGPVL